MRYEEIVFGAAAVFWGALAFLGRRELYGLAREGGRGLRDIRVLKPLVLASSLALPAAGVLLMVCRGL